MQDPIDTQAVEDTARTLLDARITASRPVRQLAVAQSGVDRARVALADAETEDASTYAATVRAGWTDSELKQMGLRRPSAASARAPTGPAPCDAPANERRRAA